jgi:hypothetical protein
MQTFLAYSFKYKKKILDWNCEVCIEKLLMCYRCPGHSNAMAHNVPRLCDVALRPTRPKGHVAEERAVARRSPRRPLRAPMHMNRCYGTLRFWKCTDSTILDGLGYDFTLWKMTNLEFSCSVLLTKGDRAILTYIQLNQRYTFQDNARE